LHGFVKLLALIATTVVILVMREKMMAAVGVYVLHVSLIWEKINENKSNKHKMK